MNIVFGSEVRIIDVSRDEVSDNRGHSVLRDRLINRNSDWGRKEKRTLGIEEDRVLPEVWPLKYTPQFRNLFLSIGSHYVDELSMQNNFIKPLFNTYIAYHLQ